MRSSIRRRVGRVTVGVNVSDRQAQLEVSDTGPGISESDLPHVFERFFRADQIRLGSVEGAGLGLSIVQSICTAHGGFVKAENHANGGCRFIVQLPLATSTPSIYSYERIDFHRSF